MVLLREKTGYEVSTTALSCIYVNVSVLYLAQNFTSPLSHSYCKTEEEPRQVNFSAPRLLTCSFTVRLGDPEITMNLWVLKSTFEMAKTLLFYWANSTHAKRTEGNWPISVYLKRTTAPYHKHSSRKLPSPSWQLAKQTSPLLHIPPNPGPFLEQPGWALAHPAAHLTCLSAACLRAAAWEAWQNVVSLLCPRSSHGEELCVRVPAARCHLLCSGQGCGQEGYEGN